MAYLILVRHGISEWNALGLWTGWVDVALTKEGIIQAQQMAELLRDIKINKAHTSKLSRAKETLHEIKKVLNLADIPTSEHEALNERHYGIYQGKNKWQIKEEVGEEAFQKIRRSWDHPIPGGESLKQVSERAVPYFEQEVLADLKSGKNIIIAASNNSLRALRKHIEGVADDEVASLEMGLGEVYIYQINHNGEMLTKEVRGKNPNAGAV